MASPANPQIRQARLDDHDLEAFVRFLADHFAESGRDGSPHFALSRVLVQEETRMAVLGRWAKRLDEPFWGRCWLLVIEPPPRSIFAPPAPKALRVVGHLELQGGRVPAEMHRATLGMGMLRAFTGQGHGRRLMDAAVAWARDEAKLSWIDLGVFANNAPARALYKKTGFVERCVREDAFHVEPGVAVDDVLMSLDLRRGARESR